MYKTLFLIVALLVAPATSYATPENDAQDAAESWLALVDSQKYDQSWAEAGAPFQSDNPQHGWAGRIKVIRDALGPETARKLLNVRFTKTLPGFPDGDYAIVQFTSSFSNRTKAAETVTLENEGGKFKAIGYFVR